MSPVTLLVITCCAVGLLICEDRLQRGSWLALLGCSIVSLTGSHDLLWKAFFYIWVFLFCLQCWTGSFWRQRS